MATISTSISQGIQVRSVAKGAVVFGGRFLFALIFLLSGPNLFSAQTIAYAASQGVPLASLTVPASGIIAMLGGLSILLGYRAKIGAWLIVLFLLPVTFMMHKFWAISDPMAAQMQMAMFMKNFAMLGGALLISQFGAGPLSWTTGARVKKRRTQMKSVKAARIHNYGGPEAVRVEDVSLPGPQSGQVVIRVHAAGRDTADDAAAIAYHVGR